MPPAQLLELLLDLVVGDLVGEAGHPQALVALHVDLGQMSMLAVKLRPPASLSSSPVMRGVPAGARPVCCAASRTSLGSSSSMTPWRIDGP